MIRIKGTISNDARLSGLALEGADGGETITLSPPFATGKYTYTAAVVNRIDAVKLTAKKNDDNAMVIITNDDDTDTAGEAVLNLSVGPNTLTVTVTAQDGTAELTYTVTVERHTADTLISNTHLSASLNTNTFLAQSFETGANEGGYTVSEVDIRLQTASGRSTSVKIRKNNADNEPGDLVATLTNPASLTSDSLNTFTAQDVITLDARTTYWITVGEGISSNRARVYEISGNDQTGETGWSIGDGSLLRSTEADSWSNSLSSLLIAIKGTAIPTISLVSNTHLNGTASNNLFQAQSFETGPNAGGYTVSEVDMRLGTASGRSARVSIRDDDNGKPGDLVATLTNPGTLTTDSLNTFTAPAGTTLAASTTYWITVNEGISSNRAEFRIVSQNGQTGETGWNIGDSSLRRVGEADIWSTSTSSLLMAIKGTAIPTISLVSNTHLSGTESSNGFEAQSFETGANLDGYTVSEVDIRFGQTSGRSTSVKIRKNNADNQPGDLVATLTNPGTLTSNSLNTFTAQTVITLAASTTYWITVGEGVSGNKADISLNDANAETGETGWSIGDGRLSRGNETQDWIPITYSLLMTIKGTVVPCDGIWCATLTVQGLGSGHWGCDNTSAGYECTNYLSDDDFTHGLTDVQRLDAVRPVRRTVAPVAADPHPHQQPVPGASRRFRNFRLQRCGWAGSNKPGVEQFRS